MPTTTTIPTSAMKSCSKRSFDDMTHEDLIEELEARDITIAHLQKECKRLKSTITTSTKNSSSSAVISPVKAFEQAAKLRKIAYRGIKSQMKWKPSCKHGTARWSFTALCDEPTFRAFMGLTKESDKTKGGKVEIEDFEEMLQEGSISTSIRYGYLCLRNNHVNITYSKADGQIKITGAYGM